MDSTVACHEELPYRKDTSTRAVPRLGRAIPQVHPQYIGCHKERLAFLRAIVSMSVSSAKILGRAQPPTQPRSVTPLSYQPSRLFSPSSELRKPAEAGIQWHSPISPSLWQTPSRQMFSVFRAFMPAASAAAVSSPRPCQRSSASLRPGHCTGQNTIGDTTEPAKVLTLR